MLITGRKSAVLIVILLFNLCFCINAASDDVTLMDFISKNNFSFRWSPILDTGELKYGEDVFSFKPGEDFLVYNYREKISGSRINRDGGVITIDSKTAEIILSRSGFSASVRQLKPNPVNARPSGHRIAAIIIDPGHGGRDSGAIGRHEIAGNRHTIYEKDIVLEIALELNRKLTSTYNDKKIILTRNNDSYPSLDERVEKANNVKLGKNEAIVFVSIHANASFNINAKGFEVWYLPPDFRRDLIDGDKADEETKDILPILNTMLEEEFTIESILLAQSILDGLDKSIGSKDLNRGLKEETWFVVKNAKMPSVLIEVGFVSNKEESIKLSDKNYLKKISEGIYNGIIKFIDNLEMINTGGE
ncbi:MAG: N-acetylmuramoyl-L-alanine amidase [Spirochaetia bacterium]|jgi:N-acetylmuramoyl-L-alanine amidase|nr:N-acetylmuramoyl-L-alanine amidase [Spirochaetia bacterium]